VRHSPTCPRKACFTFKANPRATGTCRSAHQLAGHFIDRAHLLDRQAGVDRFQNSFVILGVEPMIGLHRDHGQAQAPRLAHQGAGLDAERLGRVAGGDRHRGIGQRLHDQPFDADRKTIAAASRQLTAQLAEALELCITQHVERAREQTPFPETSSAGNPPIYFQPNEVQPRRHEPARVAAE
jgi:hypothetical protein